MRKTAFISYCHESAEHRQRVRELADSLVKDGIDCTFDQYEGDPEQGWIRWMEEGINRSDFVLLVCSENYSRGLAGGRESKDARGIRFESLLTSIHVYENGSQNHKVLPVVFSSNDLDFVPKSLRAFTSYVLDCEAGYEKLYRRMTDQHKVQKPPLGEVRSFSENENIYAHDDLEDRAGDAGGGVITDSSKMEIELSIDRDFDSYSAEEQQKLLQAIQRLLRTDRDLIIKKKRRGSVKLTLELSPAEAERLYWKIASGELDEFGVVGATMQGSTVATSTLEEPKPRLTTYSDNELEYFKELILKRRIGAVEDIERLLGQLHAAREEAENDTAYSFHLADTGSDAIEREKLYLMVSLHQKHIGHLDRALERIANKTYGICKNTGKTISKERLEAVPHTEISIEGKLKSRK